MNGLQFIYCNYQLINRKYKPITIEIPGVNKVKTSFEKREKKIVRDNLYWIEASKDEIYIRRKFIFND